jgi:hypothetical protein
MEGEGEDESCSPSEGIESGDPASSSVRRTNESREEDRERFGERVAMDRESEREREKGQYSRVEGGYRGNVGRKE